MLPEDIDLERARAIVFPPGRTAYVITADERDDWAYEAALDAAEELIRQWGTSSGSSTEKKRGDSGANSAGIQPARELRKGGVADSSRLS